MAEAASQEEVQGSEFVYDFYCHVCQDEGRHLEATGYCQNCKDYLCKNCFDNHCRPRPCRDHILLSIKDMPKGTCNVTGSTFRKVKCTEKCHEHQEEFIQYYCQDDDTLGCSVCATMNHRSCTGLLYIPDVSGGICYSGEFKDLLKDLNFAKDRTTAIINVSQDNETDIKKYFEDIIVSIREFRKQLKSTLDNIERAIKAQAKKIKTNDEQKMKTISENGTITVKNIETMANTLNMLQSSQQDGNLFVAIKKARALLKSLNTNLDKTEQDNVIKHYQFQSGNELQKFLQGKDAYGKIIETDPKATQRATVPLKTSTVPTPTDRENVDITKDQSKAANDDPVGDDTPARLVATIKVSSKNDKKKCWITGAIALDDKKVVVTDHQNKAFKVIEIMTSQIVSEACLSDGPWDITRINSSQLAATVPDGKYIAFLSYTKDINVERKVKVNGSCHGIVYSKKQLIVSYVKVGKVEILSLNGDLQHIIASDSAGRPLFDWPYYLAMSPDQNTIYVSDSQKHTVTCISSTGQVLTVYEDAQLKYPTGLVTDTEGRVFICCLSSRNIHVMAAQGQKIKILHTEGEGQRQHYGLCYISKSNKLLVGMSKTDVVEVYQLV